ncbi:MAG: OmpA family protein [Alphaproteobacteria bacterium]
MVRRLRLYPRASRPCTAAALAVFACAGFAVGNVATAQDTVIVGGSGLPEVEVNLGVLRALEAGSAPGHLRLPPGAARKPEKTIKLRPPTGVTPQVEAVALPSPPPPPPLPPAPPSVVTAEPAPVLTTPPPASVATSPPAPAAQPAPAAPPAPVPEPVPQPVVAAVPEPPAATAPPPQPKPVAPAPAAPAKQIAALPPAPEVGAVLSGDTLRIEFGKDSADLPKTAEGGLKSLAAKLAGSESLRVQVKAYAGSATGSPSSARRLSLSRALAVRAFLIEAGVRSTRIDVRALGNRSKDGPPDRVDIVLANR